MLIRNINFYGDEWKSLSENIFLRFYIYKENLELHKVCSLKMADHLNCRFSKKIFKEMFLKKLYLLDCLYPHQFIHSTQLELIRNLEIF